jgi:hypothetical protein
MKSKLAGAGFQLGAPTTLDVFALEKPSFIASHATTKPSFLNARPAFLSAVNFEAPKLMVAPMTSRGPGPIQLPTMPITPCSNYTYNPAYCDQSEMQKPIGP